LDPQAAQLDHFESHLKEKKKKKKKSEINTGKNGKWRAKKAEK
jgi:hypothetical protein